MSMSIRQSSIQLETLSLNFPYYCLRTVCPLRHCWSSTRKDCSYLRHHWRLPPPSCPTTVSVRAEQLKKLKVFFAIKLSSIMLPLECVSSTITSHSASQALLQATILASIPMVFRDFAIHRAATLIGQLFAYRPLEEPFASFATDRAIVPTRCPVIAHQTQFNAHHVVYNIRRGRNASWRRNFIATASVFGFYLIQTQNIVTRHLIHTFRIHCTLYFFHTQCTRNTAPSLHISASEWRRTKINSFYWMYRTSAELIQCVHIFNLTLLHAINIETDDFYIVLRTKIEFYWILRLFWIKF